MAGLNAAKLNAALERVRKKISNAATLRVGFFEDATYPDGTSVAMVAALQEFGSGPIPARSYFRTMIAEKQDSWANQIIGRLKANKWDAKKTLDELAEFVIKPQLQASIISINSPPLSPITLMLRKMKKDDPSLVVTGSVVGEAAQRVAAGELPTGVSTKPLIETSHMLNSVASEVIS